MKKALISIVVIILSVFAVICFASYYSGQQSRLVFKQSLDKMTQSPYMDVVENEFQQGLFVSKAKTTIDLKALLAQAEISQKAKLTPVLLTINHNIQHNPVQSDYFNGGGFNPVLVKIVSELEMTEDISRLYKGQTPLNIITKVYLNGEKEILLRMNQFEHTDNQDMHVKWDGAKAKVNSNQLDNELDFNVHAPELVLNFGADKDLLAIRLNQINAQGHLSKSQAPIWLGKWQMSVGQYQIDTQNKARQKNNLIHLKGIDVKMDSHLENELVMSSADILLNQFSVNINRPGDINQIKVKDLQLKTSFNRLDPVALSEIEKTVARLQAQQLPSFMVKQQILEMAMKHGMALLSKSPEIDFSVNLMTEQGKIESDLHLKYLDNPNATFGLNSLIASLQGKVNAKMPIVLIKMMLAQRVEQQIKLQMTQSESDKVLTEEEINKMMTETVNRQLKALVGQGLLKSKGEYYWLNAVFEDSKLSVNGINIPLPIPGAPGG